MSGSFSTGDMVWVADDRDAWIYGTIVRSDKDSVEVKCKDRTNIIIKNKDIARNIEVAGSHLMDDVINLVDLDELSEGAILHHTRKRYYEKKIYTFVGAILVAVNPFENLDIYGPDDISRATNSKATGLYPHVYVTSSNAYTQLMTNRKNQSILISGESGAGKTENTKKVLKYLATVAPSAKAPKVVSEETDESDIEDTFGIEEKILQSNPLLEAMGNAKTLRNNNSSRFGKWMKVDFDASFRIQGCEIVNYLLEKTRVVNAAMDERNYHIFYQLIKGTEANMKRRLHLGELEDYRYIAHTGCTTIPDIDDSQGFVDVLQALNVLHFPPASCEHMFKILAAILNLGNLNYSVVRTQQGDEAAELTKDSLAMITNVSDLLGVNMVDFDVSLRQKFMRMGKGSVVAVKLTPQQSADSRDALAKTLYGTMFDWIVVHINESLKTKNEKYSVGILDIFGFEVFQTNSFEQLCINYANEKLQYHFNDVIFNQEMDMYKQENIPLDAIQFSDNIDCVKLIEGKPLGLLMLLDEECSLGNSGTDATYINKTEKIFGTGRKNENRFYAKHKTNPVLFSVHHFAGMVDYNITGFVEKNRDTLSVTIKEIMSHSTVPLVATLFKDNTGGSSKISLGAQFRNQLISLLHKIEATEPHFIRCVKPNHVKKPAIIDGQLVIQQLRYAGLFEAIKIRKSGFSYRTTFHVFANLYQQIVDGLTNKRKNGEVDDIEACRIILDYVQKANVIPVGGGYVGKTKVFLKLNQYRTVLERLKSDKITVFVVSVQAHVRGFMCRVRLNREKYEAEKLRARIAAEKRAEEERIQAKLKEEADRKEAERRAESERLERIRLQRLAAAIIIQKYLRRYHVRQGAVFIKDILQLRYAIQERDTTLTHAILIKLDGSKSSIVKCDPILRRLFKDEMLEAKAIVAFIEQQNNYIVSIKHAIVVGDFATLTRLVETADEFELDEHAAVSDARDELYRSNRKYVVLSAMVNFLNNENNDLHHNIPELLLEARSLNIDPEFLNKTQRLYDQVGPRIKLLKLLRRAVEHVDKKSLTSCLAEAEGIAQSDSSSFARVEIKAGREMLRLLQLDELLYPTDPDALKTISADYAERAALGLPIYELGLDKLDEARLNDQIIALCDSIAQATDVETRNKFLRMLQSSAANNHTRYNIIIRAYKWSKVLSVWKNPSSELSNTHYTDPFDDNFETKSDSSDSYRESGMNKSDFIVDIQEGSSDTDTISFFGLQYSHEKPATHIQRTILGNRTKVYSQSSIDDSRYKVPEHIIKSIDNLRSTFGSLGTKPRNVSHSFSSSHQSPETRQSYLSTSSPPIGSNSIGKSTPTGRSSNGSPNKSSHTKSSYTPSPSKRGTPYSGSSPGSPTFKYSPILGIPREMQEKLHESRTKVIEGKQQVEGNSRKHFKPKKANWSPNGYNNFK